MARLFAYALRKLVCQNVGCLESLVHCTVKKQDDSKSGEDVGTGSQPKVASGEDMGTGSQSKVASGENVGTGSQPKGPVSGSTPWKDVLMRVMATPAAVASSSRGAAKKRPRIGTLSLDANVAIHFGENEAGTFDKALKLIESRNIVMSDRVSSEVKTGGSREWMVSQGVQVFLGSVRTEAIMAAFNSYLLEKTNASAYACFKGNELIDLCAYIDACVNGNDHLTFDVQFVRKLLFPVTIAGMYKLEDHGFFKMTKLYVALPAESTMSQVSPSANDSAMMDEHSHIIVLRG